MLQKHRYSAVTSPAKPRSSQLAKGHFHYISSESFIHKVSQTYFPSQEYKSKRSFEIKRDFSFPFYIFKNNEN